MKEVFDFSKVGVTKEVKYLRPGKYTLAITNIEYVKPDGKKPDGSAKTPYLDITFSGKMGEISQKFYITQKAFERIQTLHMNWFDKPCDKVFDSTDGIGAYFEKAFSHEKAKQIKRNISVGGKQGNDGKIYAEIPYTRYMIPDTVDFEEGEYPVGSPEYIWNVKMNPANPSTNTDSVMIELPGMSSGEAFSDDLPF